MTQVLIVDDDVHVLRLLTEIMEREGYQVRQASDGAHAHLAFAEQPADLVITDLLMPNKEGLELIQELRDINPDVKIIAYSGGGQMAPDAYLQFAEGMGANRVFSKPIPVDELVQAVKELLA
ncbi:MAG: response regulator [Gammaproteobacteria bacterium]|nr:MAG: response regulator [Gammaproteobacteria bacterium]